MTRMSFITADNAKQYGDSRKLAARARINREYAIAEIGWFPWIARQLPLRSASRVLDVGCGPGWFWAATANMMPEKLDLTLSDLSPGMVQEAVERVGHCRSDRFEATKPTQPPFPSMTAHSTPSLPCTCSTM